MKKTKLSQELYDNLCLSLGRNAKALNNDPGFSTLKRKLESSASTSLNGVEVSSAYLDLAVEALTHNVKVNGGKYASSLDKLVLLEIEEALTAPSSDTCDGTGPTPVSKAQPQPHTLPSPELTTPASTAGKLPALRWPAEEIDPMIKNRPEHRKS